MTHLEVLKLPPEERKKIFLSEDPDAFMDVDGSDLLIRLTSMLICMFEDDIYDGESMPITTRLIHLCKKPRYKTLDGGIMNMFRGKLYCNSCKVERNEFYGFAGLDIKIHPYPISRSKRPLTPPAPSATLPSQISR